LRYEATANLIQDRAEISYIALQLLINLVSKDNQVVVINKIDRAANKLERGDVAHPSVHKLAAIEAFLTEAA
jgi:hypothetical protein